MKVALIDYGAGNLSSVANALREVGVDPVVAAAPRQLEDATHLVLPGVGSFGDCMAQLGARGLTGPIRDWVSAGKPYFGICLGYQILFESSEESPGVEGLGLVPGVVRRFREAPGLKIRTWAGTRPCPADRTQGTGLGWAPSRIFTSCTHIFRCLTTTQ